MENEEKLRLLALLADTFNKKYKEETFAMWLEVLDDVSFADLKSGIFYLLKSSKFMPTLADIREAAAEHYSPLPKINRTMTPEQMAEFLEKQDSYADEEI